MKPTTVRKYFNLSGICTRGSLINSGSFNDKQLNFISAWLVANSAEKVNSLVHFY